MTIQKPADESNATGLSAASPAQAVDRAVANLRANEQNGWWPYVNGSGPSTEATGWCSLAMHAADKNETSSKKTTEFLLSKQNRDGGWSTAPLVGISDWSTAPAVLALRLLNHEKALANQNQIDSAVVKGSNFLFDLRTDPYRSVARLLMFLSDGEGGLHYARGWPWNKNGSYWVEPTSYSLLALKLPEVPDRSIIKSALHHASIYLHKHACKGGGWNHGANFTLNVCLPPFVVTTAEALVAMQDEPHSTTIEEALQLISGNRFDSQSSLSLAWSILALHVHGRELGNKPQQLVNHQKPDGSFSANNVVNSLSVLALLAASRNTNLLKINK